MKAEGRPLTFAGFRPKGSGKTPEVRSEEYAVRTKERAAYSLAKAQCSEAVELSKTIRATMLGFGAIKPSVLAHPTLAAPAVHALKLDAELRAIPADGPFAAKVAHAKTRSLHALLPALKAVIEEAAEKAAEARKRRDREEADRRREQVWAYWRDVACRRREAIERARALRESKPTPWQAPFARPGDPATGSLDLPCAKQQAAHAFRQSASMEDQSGPLVAPDFAGRVYGNRRSTLEGSASMHFEWRTPKTIG